MKEIFLESTNHTGENLQPGFSVDCIILSFHKKKIHVLLRKFDESNLWQLPGGFMLKDEDADHAAYRVLCRYTGLVDTYLRQFYLFSDPNRTIMEQNRRLVSAGIGGEWLMQRFVTLGYCVLVRYDNVEIAKVEGEEIKWCDIQQLPPLYSDHEHIIAKAKEMMQGFSRFVPIGEQLLPEKFTLSELRKVYEIILDKTYDRRNFHRKVLASGIITQLDETKSGSTYNPAALYSFNKNLKEPVDYGVFL